MGMPLYRIFTYSAD